MDRDQIGQKINLLRHNIAEIYTNGQPFIRLIALKLEDEINQIVIDYINKHFANTIKSITENDINDLIGFYCHEDKLKCQNFTKNEEIIEFDIVCRQSYGYLNFMSDEFKDAIDIFEFVDMDIPCVTDTMIQYHFKIGDNYELIFD